MVWVYLDCIGVLCPQPCSQHAAVAASKCNDRAAFSLELLLKVVYESSIVRQGLLDAQERGVLAQAVLSCIASQYIWCCNLRLHLSKRTENTAILPLQGLCYAVHDAVGTAKSAGLQE